MSERRSIKLFKEITNNWQNFIKEEEIPASIKRPEPDGSSWDEILGDLTAWLGKVNPKINCDS